MQKIKKSYTFKVFVTMNISHTFTEDDVESDFEDEENEYVPKTEALKELEEDIETCMQNMGGAYNIEATAESFDLLGSEDDGAIEKPKKRIVRKKKKKSSKK